MSLVSPEPIVAKWWHMASRNLAKIDASNGLLTGWHQAIIYNNADSTAPLATKYSEIIIKYKIFFQQNAYGSVIWKPLDYIVQASRC